jgi:hypothetical protein
MCTNAMLFCHYRPPSEHLPYRLARKMVFGLWIVEHQPNVFEVVHLHECAA